LVADQLSVLVPPVSTVLGAAASDTVGTTGRVTATLTDCVAEPPGPVHVNANAESALSAPVLAVPAVGRLPLQLPDATQAVASVELQVRVAEPPETTDVGATASVTVGAGVCGGTTATSTWTVFSALPPAPVQLSV